MIPFAGTPAAAVWRLWLNTALMAQEAQVVMTLRLLGMGGALPVSRNENARMVGEKLSAFNAAMMAGALATARGETPVAVAAKMVRPVRRRTRANARRLTRPRA